MFNTKIKKNNKKVHSLNKACVPQFFTVLSNRIRLFMYQYKKNQFVPKLLLLKHFNKSLVFNWLIEMDSLIHRNDSNLPIYYVTLFLLLKFKSEIIL